MLGIKASFFVEPHCRQKQLVQELKLQFVTGASSSSMSADHACGGPMPVLLQAIAGACRVDLLGSWGTCQSSSSYPSSAMIDLQSLSCNSSRLDRLFYAGVGGVVPDQEAPGHPRLF